VDELRKYKQEMEFDERLAGQAEAFATRAEVLQAWASLDSSR